MKSIKKPAVGKKVMPMKLRQPHIGSTLGKKKGQPRGTRAHTYTEK